MAASPHLKIYSKTGEYLAACRYPEDAAALVAARGEGATIREGHSPKHTVWTEGKEEHPASESFDFVRDTVRKRIRSRIEQSVSRGLLPKFVLEEFDKV
jgi:hypothetical protein